LFKAAIAHPDYPRRVGRMLIIRAARLGGSRSVPGAVQAAPPRGHDKYQRTLGRIYRGDRDRNAEQVRQGMAWAYRQYAKDATLYPMETEAKEQKRGLWRDSEPVPPWEWRRVGR
jgi:endonuclease YncB( thermonuclease family)